MAHLGLRRSGAAAGGGVGGGRAAAGVKVPGTAFMRWTIDDVHPGAYSVPDRLAMMDDQGVWAHVVYPNTVGFGGQRFAAVADAGLPPAGRRDLQRRHGRDPRGVRRSVAADGGGALLGRRVARAEVERIARLGCTA